ncbi:hypothetical protein YOLOSWAG_316 [Erwinia phage vB_EamM_Yoloswag]|uniref:Uncharacterized protein n=1 Tax=Erwinia phage vB_EamM_Yoloswag TaxID=1958956 RepID=A0A1S6L3M1_9CAUD|nr:hypothetical protein HOR66_gp316 [Erwinia phage vB_EamM_Yoloswag]AQT28785.1 hypothetical protein YOLOSWAG_316 [Erwinia phage vB_EamM_Yoloswag]
MKQPKKISISRSSMRPEQRDHKLANVVNFLLGTIGTQATMVSQTMLLNTANYHWLTSVSDTRSDTKENRRVLHKTVKDLNAYCRKNKIPLGLLIMPHTSASDSSGDDVCAIPWTHVKASAAQRSAINSLFALSMNDYGEQFVRDAKTDSEGSDVL